MKTISELTALCKEINPILAHEKYYFVSTHEIIENVCASFKEQEGTTYILKEENIPSGSTFKTSGPFALVTLSVYSDLTAVGFLATITKALAQEHISANVISAYYHDYLFIPWNERQHAMGILITLQKSYNT